MRAFHRTPRSGVPTRCAHPVCLPGEANSAGVSAKFTSISGAESWSSRGRVYTAAVYRLVLMTVLFAWAPAALGQRVLSRAEYQDRLHGMWLGQCIANWTGLRTEGQRVAPPFFTDADWGTQPPGLTLPIEFVLSQNPWFADDDTDVEYVYLHKLSTISPPRGVLTPVEIRDAWLAHMDREYIWVSNRRAYDLMGLGVRPPMTAQPVNNELWGFIDAQLTTEFFGALSPGMPEHALRCADLPIRTTAFGHAIQASQFYVVLYSLATQVPPGLSGRQRVLWLVQEARKWVVDGGKAADIVDFVLADFLANPDVNDWELTRDRIAQRYMINPGANGWQYWNWAESSVNFACGVMCLLYGEGDFKRTVQIGTLGGWDSDNQTATMGGLLGLILGYEGVKAQFPGQAFSDRFDIERTRNNLPDFLPADPQAQDRLEWMAARMMPIVDANVVAAGGRINAGLLELPPAITAHHLRHNPSHDLWMRSANNQVVRQGGTVTMTTSAPSGPNMPSGVSNPWYFGNGYEHDFRGLDWQEWRKWAYTTEGTGVSGPVTLTVEYSRPVEVWTVRFMEGDHTATGGWATSLAVQVKVGGVWMSPSGALTEVPDPARPFQEIDFILRQPVIGTGVRVIANVPPGGFLTCIEIDALGRPAKFADGRRLPPP